MKLHGWRVLALALAVFIVPACSSDDDDEGSGSGGGGGGGGGTTLPAAPTNVRVIPGDTNNNISWDAVPGATGYNISSATVQGGSPPGTYGLVQGNHPVTNIIDDTLQNGTTYYYVITAVNSAGEGPRSAEASGTPFAGGPPPPGGGAGTIAFGSANYFGSETQGSANVTVVRTVGGQGDVSATYTTTDGTAIAGVDYAAQTGTVTWVNGDMSDKIINIPVNQQAGPQGARNFTVTLSAPTGGATLGAQSSTTVTITD